MTVRDHTTPVSQSDAAARAAFRAYTLYWQSAQMVSVYPVEASPRTLDRIFAGRRDVPPGIAHEMAAHIQEFIGRYAHGPADITWLEGWAVALETWAGECAARCAQREARSNG